MKICRGKTGPHQYDEGVKRCPECIKFANSKAGKELNKKKNLEQSFEHVPGLKICRKGLHQYDASKRGCPECAKTADAISRAKRIPKGDMKICKRGIHQYSDNKRQCPECQKEYARGDKNKAYQREWRRGNSNAAYQKIYRANPVNKEKEKVRATKPERQAKRKSYLQSPEFKAKQKSYRQKPEVKARQKAKEQTPEYKAMMRASRGKRTKIAARGDLTKEQVLERLEEFDHKCGYCSTQLLTMIDGVDRYHPQYETIDHIVALLNGGQHTKINIVPACRNCNASKLNQEVWAWLNLKMWIPSEKLLPILLETTRLHQDTTNF